MTPPATGHKPLMMTEQPKREAEPKAASKRIGGGVCPTSKGWIPPPLVLLDNSIRLTPTTEVRYVA